MTKSEQLADALVALKAPTIGEYRHRAEGITAGIFGITVCEARLAIDRLRMTTIRNGHQNISLPASEEIFRQAVEDVFAGMGAPK